MFKGTTAVLVLVGGVLAAPVFSQTSPNPTQQRTTTSQPPDEQVPVFRVTVVGRTTQAVNYRHRGGATTINLRGTPLLPQSHGEARTRIPDLRHVGDYT